MALAVRAEDDAQNEHVDLIDDLDDSIDIDLPRMLGDLFKSELVLFCLCCLSVKFRLRVGFTFSEQCISILFMLIFVLLFGRGRGGDKNVCISLLDLTFKLFFGCT